MKRFAEMVFEKNLLFFFEEKKYSFVIIVYLSIYLSINSM